MADATGRIVAVVDDDHRVLESLRSLLEAAGHGVRAFPSASDFLQHEEMPLVGCVISDVGMPVTDGFELRRLVKARRPDLPVILISGRVDFDHLRGLENGSTRFFMKPFNGQELLASVAAALEECCKLRLEGLRRGAP